MMGLFPSTGIFIATAPVDLRKAFDGLAALVRQSLGHDPLSGSVYVFGNKRKDVSVPATPSDGAGPEAIGWMA